MLKYIVHNHQNAVPIKIKCAHEPQYPGVRNGRAFSGRHRNKFKTCSQYARPMAPSPMFAAKRLADFPKRPGCQQRTLGLSHWGRGVAYWKAFLELESMVSNFDAAPDAAGFFLH